jgi:hypothetical protein
MIVGPDVTVASFSTALRFDVKYAIFPAPMERAAPVFVSV